MAGRAPAPDAAARQAPPPPTSRASGDWDARARTTAQESLRYTRFVTVMRRTLLIAAIAILAVVLAYAMMPRPQNKIAIGIDVLGSITNDLTMVKPHLTGLDNDGNPYVVTADKAIQDAHNTRRARLIAVNADLTEKKQNTWITLSAPFGVLDADAHTLKLQGPIAVYSDDGYEFHTMVANVDLANGIVRGPRMIVGQGPTGNMRADSFWLNRQKRLIVLNGNVHMKIFPSALKKGKKTP